MAKKIDIKFDLDTKSVKIAGEETMKLTQQVRLLKAELASGKYSQEEFEILAKKLGDVEDQMAKTKTRSGDLLTSLQLIPGPIGEIASKFNGAISLLKQFSGFSLKDLTFQFKETLDDVKEIGTQLFKTMGITKIYETVNNALARSFVAVGVGEQAAAAGARAFSAALVTTGIGALVVALGFAINALIDYLSATDDATAANEALNATIKEQNRLFELNLKAIDSATKLESARAKAAGASEEELFKITQEGGKARLEELKKQDQALFERSQEIIKNDKIDNETKRKLREENAAAELAINQQIIDQSLALEIAGLEFAAQQRDKANQKAIQQKAKNNADQEKEDADAARKKQAADAINLEAELSLLSDRDRELKERQMRFDKEKAALIEAGFTDFINLESEYYQDQLNINAKFDKELLDQEQKAIDERKAARKEDQDSYFDLLQKTYDEESQKLFQQFGQSQEYFTKQKELDTQFQNDLQFGRERDLINQNQYTEGTAALTNARIALSNAEIEAKLADLDVVAGALSAFSQLAGENTKAGKALAIATTTIDTYIGAQKAYNSQLQLDPTAPIRAAIAAASAVVAGLARVRSIAQTKIPNSNLQKPDTPQSQSQSMPPIQVVARRSQGGFVFGNGGSITDSIPTMLSDGEFVMNAKSSALFSPMLTAMNNMGNLPNTALPISSGNQSLVDVVNQTISSRPIRTYVTAQDMSNQQQFDRTIKSRSLI
jgi:hypothetical protein